MLMKSSYRSDTFDANNSLSYLPKLYVLFSEAGALDIVEVEVEAEKNKDFSEISKMSR